MRSKRLGFFLLVAAIVAVLGIFALWDRTPNSELFAALESRFSDAVDARGNVRSPFLLTDVVVQFVPLGTPLVAAKAKLEQSGFRVVKRDDPDPGFEERYDAVRFSKQYWTIISSYEFAVVMQVSGGVVRKLTAVAGQRNL